MRMGSTFRSLLFEFARVWVCWGVGARLAAAGALEQINALATVDRGY